MFISYKVVNMLHTYIPNLPYIVQLLDTKRDVGGWFEGAMPSLNWEPSRRKNTLMSSSRMKNRTSSSFELLIAIGIMFLLQFLAAF